MKGYCPPTSMGLPITLSPPLFFVYKLMKLYDVTQVTSRKIESWTKSCYPPPPLVMSVTTHVSSIFTTLPECSNVIVRAPNLGSPPPPPPSSGPLVHPQVFA